MLYKKLIEDLIFYSYECKKGIENIEFCFKSSDDFGNLQLVASKPISVWATEDTSIVTINLTKGAGLRLLTPKDFEYNYLGVDLNDTQTVVLFNVDGKYMIYDDTLSGIEYNVDSFELNIYLKETDVYVK